MPILLKTIVCQLKKRPARNLLFFGILVLFVVISSQIQVTIKSISLLRSLFPLESAALGPEVIREIHRRDQDTRFFLFRPQKEERKYPGIILSLGIHPLGAEDPNLQKIFRTLVENGFLVLAIDSENLREAFIAPEEIQNLVAGFKFLAKHPSVEPEQIGFVGLSVGSSLAFLAAADPSISNDVQYLFWTGGYYDVRELIIETLSKSFLYEGVVIDWEPSERIKDVVRKNLRFFAKKGKNPEATEFITKILEIKDRQQLEKLFDELPTTNIAIMDAVSPKTVVRDMTAPFFVLHGTKDTYIPFVHSTQLFADFPGDKRIVLSSQYGHEAPQKSLWRNIFSLEFWQVIFLTNEWFSRLR